MRVSSNRELWQQQQAMDQHSFSESRRGGIPGVPDLVRSGNSNFELSDSLGMQISMPRNNNDLRTDLAAW